MKGAPPPIPPPGSGAGADPAEAGPSEREPDMTAIFRSPLPVRGVIGSPVELIVVKRTGLSKTDSLEDWVAFEIWTRNRVYQLDRALRCLGVVSRTDQRHQPDSPFIGSTLTGGQRRDSESVEISRPFPLPGMRAVFRHAGGSNKGARFGETSKVERFIIRLGVTTFKAGALDESRHELTARFFMSTE